MPQRELTKTQAMLYRYFSKNPNRELTRDELCEHVWGHPYHGTTRTIDQTIAGLRKKLNPREGEIVTVRAVGYRYEKNQGE